MKYTLEMFEHLSEDATKEEIERTARDLKHQNYEPLLLIDAPNFIYWKKRRYDKRVSSSYEYC